MLAPPRSRPARGPVAVLALVLGACGPSESLPPPPVASAGDDGTGSGTGPGSASVGIPMTGGGGGLPMHCRLGEAPEADGSGSGSGTAGGFKFDVGAPSGSTDFPVDCAAVEEELTNLGCEFWAVDLPNEYRGTLMSPPAAEQQFAVVIANASSLSAATVDVFVGTDDVAVDSAVVQPGEVHQFLLDPLDIDAQTSSVDGQAYRVVSDVPITAYQFNPLDNEVEVYSNDASLLLPVHALGAEYTAVTGDAVLLSMGPKDPRPINAGAFISVVATEDDTAIEVVPETALVGGPATATLDSGQVLNVISDVMGAHLGNLSGSRVTADKPVAVFSGNVATAVPANGNACCADHIEHQLPPHEAWGTAYAVAPPPSPINIAPDRALYRITAAFEGTELRYCPMPPEGAPESLGPGQTAVFETSEAFTVVADPDKPFAVTQFLMSNEALSDGQPGDPAMIVVPSLGQLQRRYLFVVPSGYAHNYVNIVKRGTGAVTLDGESVDAAAFEAVGVARNEDHTFASIPLDAGSHLVEADVPVGISVVGFDDAVSYGYPGGAGLRVIAIPPVSG